MPPFLMSALFSFVLSLVAPYSNVALPHLYDVAKVAQTAVETTAR